MNSPKLYFAHPAMFSKADDCLSRVWKYVKHRIFKLLICDNICIFKSVKTAIQSMLYQEDEASSKKKVSKACICP